MSPATEREPCPTCDRDLWHVGHVCYTYADLRARRAAAAEGANAPTVAEVARGQHRPPHSLSPQVGGTHRIGSNYCGPCGGGMCEEVL